MDRDKCEKILNTRKALNENKRKTMERIEVGINMNERSLRRSKCEIASGKEDVELKSWR